ncbi:MAG: Fe-Mn family superoxide dismutase [Minisyncoccia bacterium]
MTQFQEKTFAIPALKGISAKTIDEHLKLYSGYVKNANTVLLKIEEYAKDSEANAYALGELHRRFSFEFNGMRNHEHYFSHLEGEPIQLQDGSALKSEIEKAWGTFDAFLNRFKAVALTRGIGWAMLSYDKQTKQLLTHWVDEQHLGQLSTTQPILALDMWEHSFVADYFPSGKKQYVEDFFANLNWSTCETNFTSAL